MIRALVTQMLDCLVKLSEQSDCDIDPFTFGRYGGNSAVTAAREYLATEPKPTLKEALTQQGIKLRTEFEPKQRDHIEDSLGMVGERAELIVMLRNRHLTGQTQMAMLKAADLLEADADLRMQLARRTVERDMAISMAISMLEADAQQANKPTGWDNGLSQDYCAEFGQWLASPPRCTSADQSDV